jgi:hypothetical protein
MKNNLIGVSALLALLPMHLISQERENTEMVVDHIASATVTVLAFDTNGRFLGAPDVSRFESEGRKNIAGRFHIGVAEGVPLGEYRIEGRLPAYFSDTQHVAIYQPRVTVVLGLAFGYELPIAPPVLHGRVVGLSAANTKHSFVKLTSVFANQSMESAIASNGDFDLCGFSWGQYMLLVIGEQGVIASRFVSLPYTAPSLQINVQSDRAVTAPTP